MNNDPQRKRRLSTRGCLLILGGIPIVLCLILLTGREVRLRIAAARVTSEIERIHQSGELVTIEELEESHRLPAGENDEAQSWLRVLETFRTPSYVAEAKPFPVIGYGVGDVPLPGEPWPQREEARALLQSNELVLDELFQLGESHGAARYPLRLKKGESVLRFHGQSTMSDALGMTPTVRFLAFAARVRAFEGDSHACARSIETLMHMADSLQLDPTVSAHFFRTVIYSLACGTMEDLMPHVALSDEAIQSLQHKLQKAELQAGFLRGFIGQRVMVTQHFADRFEFTPGQIVRRSMFDWEMAPDLKLFICLRYFAALIHACQQPRPETQRLGLAAAREFGDQDSYSPIDDCFGVVGMVAKPDILTFLNRAVARVDVAATALAAERYRRVNGSFPKSLETLVPSFLSQVPIDPFDGSPLRFLVRDDGSISVYSVGEDTIDDGGKGDATLKPDIVFSIVPPSATAATR